jgi:hypothetical protein
VPSPTIATRWGKGGKTPLIKVQPRLVLHRSDLTPDDVNTLPAK